jgi:deoxyhypusine synthase
MPYKRQYLKGNLIRPKPIPGNIRVSDLVDNYFQAYNAGRIREAAHLFVEKMLKSNVTVGLSITGALTPAGLGGSCVVPLIKAGFVDWIVTTGANLYHDTHFAIGHKLHRGTPFIDDRRLREAGVIRIYDILFDYGVLLSTDAFFRKTLSAPEFHRKKMSTAEMHYLLGKYLYKREKTLNIPYQGILSTAFHSGVPVYTSSPGDSSIGMNIAELNLNETGPFIDISADVNETAAIVLSAKRAGGKSAVFILGGGSPKNFMLQTEPQIQEVLGIHEKGHDYFLQITDARPDTGGLSGATPAEAVSWGKVDPSMLPDAVVAYVDSTIAFPILTSYALDAVKKRPLRKLYQKRTKMLELLNTEYRKALKKEKGSKK